MTKMLRFTNISSHETLDMPIYINKDHIVSVYERPTDGGSLRTIIFGAGNTWHVEESVKEVIKMIEETE
jgi:uncharacterized protein YlzI (FlbEa/FlbD family)